MGRHDTTTGTSRSCTAGRKGRPLFGGGRAKDTVWEIPRPKRSESHPKKKPVELVARALTNSSRPGDLVYEPFGGSGATIIAAEQTGRRCVALEIDPRYAQVVIERWAAFPAAGGAARWLTSDTMAGSCFTSAPSPYQSYRDAKAAVRV